MEASGQQNFFVRHWRGELPLPLSFWLNGVLVSVIMLAGARYVAENIDVDTGPGTAIFSLVCLWIVIALVTAFQVVGIWRSAARYASAKPEKAWWGVGAQVVMCMRVLQFCWLLASQGVPQIDEVWRIADDADPVGKFQFRVLRDATELELSGGLSYRVAREAEKYLDDYPTIRIIHLNSQGGRIREARALARVIEDRKLSTYTSAGCFNACIIPFAAGETRLIRKGTRMAFHQYEVSANAQSAYEKDRVYLIARRGIDADFVNRIYDTPPDQVWQPSDDEMLKAHFITGYASSNDVAFSGIKVSDVPQIEQALLQLPLYAALKKSDPAAYKSVLKAVQEGVERGKSLAEIRAATMPVIERISVEKLPFTSDDAVVEFTNVAIEEMKTLQKKDPALCYNFAFSRGDAFDYPRLFPAQLNERESDATAGVIAGYSRDRKVPTADEFQADFADLGASWAKLYGGDIKLLSAPVPNPADQAKACQLTISLYQLAVSLPEDKAAAVLRYLYDQRLNGARASAP
jgi:hypothetical protein